MAAAVAILTLLATGAATAANWARASGAERKAFAERLDSTAAIDLPAVSGQSAATIQRPFLCFTEAQPGDFTATDDDRAAFAAPCLDARARPGPLDAVFRSRVRALLLAAFVESDPVLRKLLLSPRFRRLAILSGSGVNGTSAELDARDGKPQFAIGVNAAVFRLDTDRGLADFQSYYDGFMTLRGGLDHRQHTLVERGVYVALPGGPRVRVERAGGGRGALYAGPVGVLVKVLHHELGHYLLSYAAEPALAPGPGAPRGDDSWSSTPWPDAPPGAALRRDSDFPALIYAAAPASRRNLDYRLAAAGREAARDRLCFARLEACGERRHAVADAAFAADVLAVYHGTGILDSVAAWKPDEAFCEWLAFDALSHGLRRIVLTPSPNSTATVDPIAELRGFPRRTDVEAYASRRRKLFSASLDALAAAEAPK